MTTPIEEQVPTDKVASPHRNTWFRTSLLLAVFAAGVVSVFLWFRPNRTTIVLSTSAENSSSPSSVPTTTPVPTASPTAHPTAHPTPSPTSSPVPTPTPQPTSTAVSSGQLQSVHNAIQSVVDANPNLTIGVSFIDINSGDRTDVNGGHVFTGASTTKVFIACLLLSQVEAGNYSLSQPLGVSTVGDQLRLMINQSDNDSWSLFMNMLGFPAQPPYAQKIGITSYNDQNNQIDPNDEALLLDKLYAGQLLNASDTKLLLSYMQHTNMEALIPPAVSSGSTVYHKYGELDDLLHDAAIIDNGKTPFVLTIYTENGSGALTYNQIVNIFHQIVSGVEKVVNAK